MGWKACRDMLNAWENMLSHVNWVGEHVGTCQVGGGVCMDVSNGWGSVH
jgi:hypothetical protein